MTWCTLGSWQYVGILWAQVVFDEPIHVVVFGLETHIERADGIVIRKTIFEDGVDMDCGVAVVAWRSLLDFAQDLEERSRGNEYRTETV